MYTNIIQSIFTKIWLYLSITFLVCVFLFVSEVSAEKKPDLNQSSMWIDGVYIGEIMTSYEGILHNSKNNSFTKGLLNTFSLGFSHESDNFGYIGDISSLSSISKKTVSKDMDIYAFDVSILLSGFKKINQSVGSVIYDFHSSIDTIQTIIAELYQHTMISFMDIYHGSFNMVGQLLVLPRREDAYVVNV